MLVQGFLCTGRNSHAPYHFAWHLSYKRLYTLSIHNCQLHINCVQDSLYLNGKDFPLCVISPGLNKIHHLGQTTTPSDTWK